jgi:hypothetical protein
MVLGSTDEWTAFLDDRLADEGLAGDARVNWLLARAMAEEISRNPPGRNYVAPARLSSGSDWLEEAALVAGDPATRLRLQKEWLARHAAMQQWEAAAEIVNANPALAPSSQNLTELKQIAAEAEQREIKESNAAYLAELRRRQKKAADAGDTARVERYDAVIRQIDK